MFTKFQAKPSNCILQLQSALLKMTMRTDDDKSFRDMFENIIKMKPEILRSLLQSK